MRKILFCLGLFVPAMAGASAVLKDVEFTHTADAGFGNEICVLGPHPALGGNDPLRAIKLTWTPGNVWRGTVALPAGLSTEYRFLRRSFANTDWGDPAQFTNLTANLPLQVAPHPPAPWGGKIVFLHSTWEEARILYRDLTGGGAWTLVPMRVAGDGRHAGERLFRVELPVSSGAALEFVFNNGDQSWLNAPAPPPAAPYTDLVAPYNFRTVLDVFFVQDQQVFNYRPPPAVSAPTVLTREVGSMVQGIPGRPVTIILPRGYEQNTWKRYPVVYFHDGQNVFFPGGPFGTWDADRIAAYETAQGRMREAILVAIPNGNALGSDRLQEYLPNGDTITLQGGTTTVHAGRAAQYTQFLVDHVLPTLDFNFRTLGDAANTVVAGSSMGGLVSDYIGHTRGDRFGMLGIFSPAYWAAPNFTTARPSAVPPAVRRFVSMGTAEASSGESGSNIYWQGGVAAYNDFLRAGQSVNRSLLFEGVAGGRHNEVAWARLMPRFFGFALDPWREAQPLALETHPPALAIEPAPQGVRLRHERRLGLPQELLVGSTLGSWTTNAIAAPADPWDLLTEEVPTGGSTSGFWRLRTRLSP